jgi:hypothetical protein
MRMNAMLEQLLGSKSKHPEHPEFWFVPRVKEIRKQGKRYKSGEFSRSFIAFFVVAKHLFAPLQEENGASMLCRYRMQAS